MKKTTHKVRTPYSVEEVNSMDAMIEQLISIVTNYTGDRHSVAVNHFASDVTDILVDIKIDLGKLTNNSERNSDAESEAIH